MEGCETQALKSQPSTDRARAEEIGRQEIVRTPSASSSAATTCGCKPATGLAVPKPHTYVMYVLMTATTLQRMLFEPDSFR